MAFFTAMRVLFFWGGFMKTAAIIIFILMYIVIIVFPKRKTLTVLIAAGLFLLLGILPFKELPTAVDWNALLMLFGTMMLVDSFIESKMPNYIADRLLEVSPNIMWVTILMSLFSGFISAFIDNVATVLMVAPVALALCMKLNISPVPMVISIAVSSNLQGAATLVGDTTSIMLGAYAKMDFMSFFWMENRPGIFFAVELGALATVPIMMILFRKNKEKITAGKRTEVTEYMPTIMMLAHVILLVAASFVPDKPEITNGVICVVCGLINYIYYIIRYRDIQSVISSMKNIDYETIILLAGLFTVIGGISYIGIIDDIAGVLSKAGGGNIFVLFTVIVWGSVAVSAFVDNIPYVASMLPVLKSLTAVMGIEPYLLYFGLLTGATLGGNITPIGASANITAVGMLKKRGYDVSFKDFMRIGIPFTLAAVLTGYLYLWFVWR